MASFSAGTTFTDGVANDVTAAKLGALVNNATPTSGLIQDRTAETITATNDTLLIGDASDSNNLKRITVANFAQTLPTAKVTTGTIDTATLGTTTGTMATFTGATITNGTIASASLGTTTITNGTITTGVIPTLTSTTLITSGTGTAAAPAIVPTGDTNTGAFFPVADAVAISTQGTERLRIDSSGNVLIGTDVNASTQGGKLQVITDSVIRRNVASTGGAALRIEKSRSATDGGYTIVQDGDTIGDIQFYGSDGVDFAQAATIRGIVNGTPGSNDMPGALLFLTSPDGSQTPSERLRIDSSGNVGIGTTSPAQKLHILGIKPDTGSLGYNALIDEDRAAAADRGAGVAFGLRGAVLGGVEMGCNASATTDAYMTFNTVAGGTVAERLRIDSTGDVSIGTATALSKLHVHGNITLSNTTTATSAGTSTITPPATVAGYLTVSINGTSRKIPYYAT